MRVPFAGWWRSRRPNDDEIARELRDHLELDAEQLQRQGVTTNAADVARRRFGNVSNVRETVREVWRRTWVEQTVQDVRHGSRALIRNPVYALTATITLALGVGATTTVFSLGDGLVNRPFPLLPQDDLLSVVQASADCPTCTEASPAAFAALRSRATSMSAVAAGTGWRTTLRRDVGSDVVEGYRVSANTFSMIKAPFALGHGFAPDADVPGHDGVTVLSYQFWQDAFGGRASVLDSTIALNGLPHRVVGVLARDLAFPVQTDLYAPLVLTAADFNDHASRYLDLFARLTPGRTVEQARREAGRIGEQLGRESPQTNAGWTLVARPLKEFHTDDVRTLLSIIGAAVALVLLAACVSVASLAMARTAARRRELALRAALGARRGRLARHLLVESLLVGLAGGVGGVGLAVLGMRAIHGAMPASMTRFVPGWAGAHVDPRALLFTLVVSVGASLTFALLPTARALGIPLSSVLSDGGRANAGGVHGTRWRSALTVAEISVALVLLTGAALIARSVRNMSIGDPGVRRDQVLTMHLSLPRSASDSETFDFIRRLDRQLHATQGVRGAGLASTTPLSNNFSGTYVDIPGRTPPKPDQRLTAVDQRMTSDYFRTMGIRVTEGRGILSSDTAGAGRVVVINRYMADQLWPGIDPIGHAIVMDSLPWMIVGVAADVRHGGFDEPMRYEVDRSIMQAITRVADLEVWTEGDPARMADPVRRAVATVDPAAAVGSVMTMRGMEARHLSPFRMIAGILSIFAAVTMVIAIVGLYGVIAYGVAQRTREIGVRIALGATTRDVVSHVTGGALRLSLIGAVIGGVGAFAFAQLLRSVLYRVTATDPTTPMITAVTLVGIAMLAALIPAWRAAHTDPCVALRE